MNVTVRIPDDFAKRLGAGDLGRKALEALALQEYRAGRLNESGLSDVLGFTTQAERDGFLSANGITAPIPETQRIATSRPASAPSALERPSVASIPGH